jgi:hypothetical protein
MIDSLKWLKQHMKKNSFITSDKYELLYRITKEVNHARNEELFLEYLCDGKNDDLIIYYINLLLDGIEANIDLEVVENFWACQVQEYFRNQPFVLSTDPSRTIGASLDELFAQARTRQKQNPGTQYLGAMLQHLIAAKLSIILPENAFEIHDASVADSPTSRSGDFVIHKTIIHCTTAPGEPLMENAKRILKTAIYRLSLLSLTG